MSKILYSLLLCVLYGLTIPILAQEQGTTPAVDLNPVVVTGTGTPQRLKQTIVPVQVIKAKQIEQSGATETQQLLEQMVPALSFTPNAMGSYLRMNGLPNKYILILVNGRRLNGDLSQNIDLNRINPQDIERLEVLNGAASTLYGSDAIGGVINIITKKAQTPIKLSSHAQYDTYGAFRQGLILDVKAAKFSTHTSTQYVNDKGWQQSTLAYTDPDSLTTESTLMQTGKAYCAKVINQKFTFEPNDSWDIYIDGQYYTHATNRPVYTQDISGGSKYNLEKEAFNIGLGSRYALSKVSYISVDAFADSYVQNKAFLLNGKTYKQGDTERYKMQSIFDVRTKGVFEFIPHTQSVFGIEYRRVNLQRPIAFLDKSIYNLSAFAQHEQQLLPNLKAIGGISLDYYQNGKWHVSPKAAVMYNLSNINIRFNYANGFRTADIKEMYYFYASRRSITLGTEDLAPEKSHYCSVNAEYRNKKFSLSASPYINHMSDMINIKTQRLSTIDSTYVADLKAHVAQVFNLDAKQLAKIKSLRTYRNINKARIKGVHLASQLQLGLGLNAYANYAYTLAQVWTEKQKWQDLERSIRHSMTYGVNYTHYFKAYTLNVNVALRTQSERLYPHDDYGNAPGYTTMNLMTNHSFVLPNKMDIVLALGVKNIFNTIDDRPYSVNYGLFSPGRTFMFGLKIKI